MKPVICIALLSVLYAQDTTVPLHVDNSIQLTNYSHRTSVKMQHKRKLERLAIVKKKEAKEIAQKVCQEPITSIYLDHKGQLLFYKVSGRDCYVKINALDGTILSKRDTK